MKKKERAEKTHQKNTNNMETTNEEPKGQGCMILVGVASLIYALYVLITI